MPENLKIEFILRKNSIFSFMTKVCTFAKVTQIESTNRMRIIGCNFFYQQKLFMVG
jgi:hypothetical protein